MAVSANRLELLQIADAVARALAGTREPSARQARDATHEARHRIDVSANDHRRADLDEPVHALGFALREANATVRCGIRRYVG